MIAAIVLRFTAWFFIWFGLLQLFMIWARRQPIGTRSVVYGAHCFLIHWVFVAMGWFTLYKFSRVKIGRATTHDTKYHVSYHRDVTASLWDPRLWVAFFIHDLGYWGKPNMDGDEGETHPEWACGKMNQWFGAPWGAFVLTHSRFYAKKMKLPVSPLCYADKLAIVYTPAWLYLPMVRATGEIVEYMKLAQQNNAGLGGGKYSTMNVSHHDEGEWCRGVKAYVRKWVAEHKDGRDDTWTPDAREAADTNGVWK
jgi:hypothetical protein